MTEDAWYGVTPEPVAMSVHTVRSLPLDHVYADLAKTSSV